MPPMIIEHAQQAAAILIRTVLSDLGMGHKDADALLNEAWEKAEEAGVMNGNDTWEGILELLEQP